MNFPVILFIAADLDGKLKDAALEAFQIRFENKFFRPETLAVTGNENAAKKRHAHALKIARQ